MSSRTDFRNALQALTSTVVKAEAARGSGDDAAFADLKAASLPQWRTLRARHAVLEAELRESEPGGQFPHAGWLAKTVARAEALFGEPPGESEPE